MEELLSDIVLGFVSVVLCSLVRSRGCMGRWLVDAEDGEVRLSSKCLNESES